MSAISISKAKEIRESLGATHLVIFSVDEDGTQHVATHGQTDKNAAEAAAAGNNLKRALKWDESLCNAKPLERRCENCIYWKADYGAWCFNGWSGDGSSGWCQYDPGKVKTAKGDRCHNFEPKG